MNSSEEEQDRIIRGKSVHDTIMEEEEESEDFQMVDRVQDDKSDKRKCKRVFQNLHNVP